MRSLPFVPAVVVALAVGLAPSTAALAVADAPPDEAAAVRRVVTDAYVDGIHNFRDPVAIRAGFHADFEMLVLREGRLEKLPLASWIERLEAQNAKEAPPSRDSGARSTAATFPLVDVVGTAAICKVELRRGDKLVFTDFLNLYKFEDGWKIVGKSFYRHP